MVLCKYRKNRQLNITAQKQTHVHGHLIYNKGGTAKEWRNDNFLSTAECQLGVARDTENQF